MTVHVGFIGLGQMGLPMLCSLSRNTNLVICAYDTEDAPFDRLACAQNVRLRLMRAKNLADLAQCSHVIMMLPNSRITNAVIEGTQDSLGLGGILGPGSTIIDMGSSNPLETQRLAEKLMAQDMHLVDAPVSGSVAKAENGTLSIMVGCDDETLTSLRFIFDYMGSEVFATGRVGSAHALKALNNYVYAAGLLAVSEAACIAERLDLGISMLARVLNSSSGRNVASETKLTQFIETQTYNGGFSLNLQAKDLQTAVGLQDLTGFNAEQLNLCNRIWADALGKLSQNADNTEIHKFINASSTKS